MISNKNKHTCERKTVEINRKKKYIQDIFIEQLSFFTLTTSQDQKHDFLC